MHENISMCVSFTGIVSFYRDFLEALYENLEGHASITGKKYALKIFEIIILFSSN